MTVAVSLAGGVTGPGFAWGMALVAAAAVLGRPFREAGLLGLLALALSAAAEMAALSPAAPSGWLRGLTAVAALGTTAWALTSALGRGIQRTAAPAGDGPPAGPARGSADAGEAAELRRRLEEAERAREEAVSANAAKSRFLANMSHELRTPLNAIMGFADIMRNRLFGPLPDRYAEYSQLIHESGQHLLDLINDVLDMAKIEADRYRLAKEVFDAREALTAVLRLMRPQAEEAGVDLRAVLPDEPLTVDADKRALKQIALNLMSNALKFTPTGGSITVTLEAVEEALELTVADTGVGVAPEDLERLGRPFEQAGGPESRAQGTGLGLSLVRAFAGLHGGEMSIESVLGEGTAVTVRMPVLASAESPQDAPSSGQVIPFSR
jgi:cell cycle sensor histidine kinase DivJ